MPFTKKTTLASQFCTFNHNDTQHLTTTSSTACPLDLVASYNKPIINPLLYKTLDRLPISNGDLSGLIFSSSPHETSITSSAKSSMDASSLLLRTSSSVLGDFSKTSEGTTTNFGGLQEHSNYYHIPLLRDMQGNIGNHDDNVLVKIPNNVNVPHVDDQQLETVRSIGFPFTMPFNVGDAWKSNLLWDTSSCGAPSS